MGYTFNSSSCQKHTSGTSNHYLETVKMKPHTRDGRAENWKEFDFQIISMDTCMNSILYTYFQTHHGRNSSHLRHLLAQATL